MNNLLFGLLKMKADLWIDQTARKFSGGVPEPLLSSLGYALTTGGKRLRPILAMLGARIAGKNEDEVQNFAVAVELIHTYSLVHDDLPSMDNDEFRRGKPTVHVKFGESIAVLTGDALLNFAYETLFSDLMQNYSENRKKAASILAEAAGCFGMIKGQVLDISTVPTAPEVVDKYKTGELFKAALLGGATIAGASEGLLDALSGYADCFGRAFQIADDLSDFAEGEDSDCNYAVFYGKEKAVSDAKLLLEEAKNFVKPFKGREELWALADEILSKIPA